MSIKPIYNEELLAMYLRETGTNTFPDFKVIDVRQESDEDARSPLDFEVIERCLGSRETDSHYVTILDVIAWSVSRAVTKNDVASLKNTIIIECDSPETCKDVAKLMTDVVGLNVAAEATDDGTVTHDNYGLGLTSTPVGVNHTKVKGGN